MNLREGTILQGGKYRIERELGHGGFGITYLATQVGLNRRVAIKEFFMSEYCNRDADTSHVSVPSEGSKELVAKFRTKFIKEAQTIAEMDNHHIIRIHDVFEDNGTAYYVMEYLPGGDLRSRIPSGGMPEAEAVGYIREVADALRYIHAKNILHLDIKPTNILFRGSGEAVLIDFGISKHYDDKGGSQTSSTPVGISEGYAPTEQYEREGVSSFAASTDIYALGATLYCLLCGSRPPKASIVLNDGLPALPRHVSTATRTAVEQAMQPRRKDRPQSVEEFLNLLDAKVDEVTVIEVNENADVNVNENKNKSKHENLVPTDDGSTSTLSSTLKKYLLPAVACVVVALAVVFWPKGGDAPVKEEERQEILPPAGRQNDTEQQQQQQTSQQSQQTPVKEEPAVPTTTPLYVTTTPSGVTVYVDGKKVGTTPVEGKEIARGSHKVKLGKEGYEDKTLTRTFGDKPVVINETLVETPKPQQTQSSSSTSTVATTGKINGHEYVDLGLSVKWATCNVGASSPSAYGNHYAWGETEEKSNYTPLTYKYYLGDLNRDGWYYDTNEYQNIGSNISGTSYDVAHVKWGGSWRLPTMAEFEELEEKCSWVWTTQDGHNGYKVTGKNGKSIFLPAAGYRDGTRVVGRGSHGDYSSGSQYLSYGYVHSFHSGSHLFGSGMTSPYLGRTVRPVTDHREGHSVWVEAAKKQLEDEADENAAKLRKVNAQIEELDELVSDKSDKANPEFEMK